MKILVINAGSSSLKYQLIDMAEEKVIAKGLCERIGIDGHLKHTPMIENKAVYDENISLPNHSVAISAVIDKLTSKECGVINSMSEVNAVGHRVVHGGERFSDSVLIDEGVLDGIKECSPFAPLHNPANLTGIDACQRVLSNVPQVAVFDTSFHQSIPSKAYIYAIPYKYYEVDKVRRYGFHGTSHRFVSERASKLIGRPLDDLKLISCHMGNGSSICAIEGGKSVDTSMGFTPLVGLPMGTRCGQMDMGAVQYMMHKYNYSIDEMLNILNKKSGVLGISGVSSDFRDLDESAAGGNRRAELALDVFNYWVAKTVGGYVAAMNGVDAIIFTAGVGENSASTRSSISKYFQYLDCRIDPEKNKKRGEELVISTLDSKVKLLVIPTNEELLIARDTKKIVDNN